MGPGSDQMYGGGQQQMDGGYNQYGVINQWMNNVPHKLSYQQSIFSSLVK